MDEIVAALNVLHTSTDTEQCRIADIVLREHQKSTDAWSIVNEILTSDHQQEVYIYAAQTLRNKIRYDFLEIPRTSEVLCSYIFEYLERHKHSKRIVEFLSLALAALSVQIADLWNSPIQTVLDRFPLENEQNTSIVIFVLTNLASENKNRQILADTYTRDIHKAILRDAQPKVFALLESIGQNAIVFKPRCLVCWCSWIECIGIDAEALGSSTSFEDCFKILLFPSNCEELINNDSAENIEEVALESIKTVLEIANENGGESYKNVIENILGLFKDKNIINNILKRINIPTNKYQNMNNKNNKNDTENNRDNNNMNDIKDDILEIHEENKLRISLISHLLSTEFFINSENIINNQFAIVDQLIQLMFNYIIIDPYQYFLGNNNNDDLLIISSDALYAFTNISENSPVSILHTHQLYDYFHHFLDVVIKKIVPLSPEHLRSSNFIKMRGVFLESVFDCTSVLGEDVIVKKLLTQLNSTPGSELLQIEAILYILSETLIGTNMKPKNTPFIRDFLTSIDSFYLCPLSTDILDIKRATYAASILRSGQPWLAETPEYTLLTINSFITWIGNSDLSHDVDLLIMQTDALTAMCVSDIPKEKNTFVSFAISQLAISKFRTPQYPAKVTMRLFRSAAAMMRTLDDNDFLRGLETICNPLVAALGSSNSDLSAICTYLDATAIILKEISASSRKNDTRTNAMSIFIHNILWIYIKRYMTEFPGECNVIERCIRCLKHAIRSSPSLLLDIMPDIMAAISHGSRLSLHAPHLYGAEVILGEYHKSTDMRRYLVELFNQLSVDALRIIENEESVALCTDMVEDYFGMYLRFFKYAPIIPLESDSLQSAMNVLIMCMSVEEKCANTVTYNLLSFLIKPLFVEELPNEELIRSTIRSLVAKHIPSIVERTLQILLSVPLDRVVDTLETTLRQLVVEFPQEVDGVLSVALLTLPKPILPTETMRDEVHKGLMYSRFGKSFNLLANRCMQFSRRTTHK